jgi:hypothetical protein
MNDLEYIKKQKLLHNKALAIIADLRLIELLNKFGEVRIVGSVELELMSWPDIDLVVFSEPNITNFLEVISELFPKTSVYSMNIQDFRKSIYPDRPHGIYCGLNYLEKPHNFWKIDIWFLPKEEDQAIRTVKWVKERINDRDRAIILKIKNEMREKLEFGKKISGMEVYKAVLDKNVKNLKEFKDYLSKTGWRFD